LTDSVSVPVMSELPAPATLSEETPTLSDISQEASVEAFVEAFAEPLQEIDPNQQVRVKSEEGRVVVIFPPETGNGEGSTFTGSTWTELWQQFKIRLTSGDRFWEPETEVELIVGDRLLDNRQLQLIEEALTEVQLQLKRVTTNRRQTAVAAATAGYSVIQNNLTRLNPTAPVPGKALSEPLYLEMTVRSGVEIRHRGSIVLVGDLNPGGSIVADGDILVWGRLRGFVHAGSGGNVGRVIMALQMEPTLIRIGEYVARSPEGSPTPFCPEVAYVTSQGIRISPASDFDKSLLIGTGAG
jgi:septum site-determining protein MinC